MNQNELLPCPFCGSKAETYKDSGCSYPCGEFETCGYCEHLVFWVQCSNDNCNEPQNTKSEAITAWNTRK